MPPPFFLALAAQCFQNRLMADPIRRLPLFVALTAFVLFVGTMGGGVTIDNLPMLAKVAGWDETPMAGQPLLWLLALPLRALPAAWALVFLKLFSAAVAAAILGLLARTVQLLPWDQPWKNASPLTRALPLLTAGVVCGLEFGFWQEATTANGEMLDLLLLAAAVWLLREYQFRKLHRNPRWLNAAALVWGIGMAENWLMLLALPLFVAALIRLQRKRFFRWKFILRMAGFGLAGFSVYALPPLVNGLAPHSPWSFDQAWLASLRQTKHTFELLYYNFWVTHRFLMLGVVVCFLAPTLPLIVRLRDDGMRNKSRVDRLQLWIYRSLRAALLLALLWLAFDPSIGPQQLVRHEFGFWMPMLTFDYLNALGAGFLAGNLLLIAQNAKRRRRARIKIRWREIAGPMAAGFLAIVLAGLMIRNAPAIVRFNFYPLEKFGDLALQSLPSGRGVMLSDFPQKLGVFQAALARRHREADWLAVDTHKLPTVEYRARLERRLPAGWLTETNRHPLTPLETVRLLETVAQSNRVFYLHPSYGYFFERFYQQPAGTIYEMKLRGKDPLDVPPMTSAEMDANEKFWNGGWDKDLEPLTPPRTRPPNFLKQQLLRLGYTPAPRVQDRVLAEWFSIALDGWAVALQRQGHLPAAQSRLQQALKLNANNASALVSLACNTNLQAKVPMGLADVAKVANQIGNPGRLNVIMDSGGPFDEPTVTYLLGGVFLQAGLLLQSAEEFERVRTLAASAPAPEFALAEIYNRLEMSARARPLIAHLREEIRNQPTNNVLDLDLALLETYSWLLQTNVANASSTLASVVAEHPEDAEVRDRVLGAYVAIGDFTNALRLLETQLAKTPDDVPALNSKAIILVQAGRAAEALPIFDQVLSLTNLLTARINRAYARLNVNDFAAAERDFSELENTSNAVGMASFGLAEVAEHRQDTNQAVIFLRRCLTNTPAGSPLWRQASAQLQTIEPAIQAE
jgi:tetratricopeptide (TPR) repeat protein